MLSSCLAFKNLVSLFRLPHSRFCLSFEVLLCKLGRTVSDLLVEMEAKLESDFFGRTVNDWLVETDFDPDNLGVGFGDRRENENRELLIVDGVEQFR